MTSQIDPTVPVFGTPTTASVRNNFLIAKREIEAIQGLIGGTPSGSFGPPIIVSGSGPIALPSSANYFVFVGNTTGGPISSALPAAGLVLGQQIIIKDTLGNAGTFNITVTASAGIDGFPTYVLVANYMSVSLVWMGGSGWGTF
jgi:hypothetical protein